MKDPADKVARGTLLGGETDHRTPPPVKLADPSTTPLIGATGRQERDRPIFARSGGSTADKTQWEVEVTPLVATTNRGRNLDASHPEAPAHPKGTLFEIRAAYFGVGPAAFGRIPGTRKVDHTHTEDVELARVIAKEAVRVLQAGGRDRFDLIALAKEVERRRSA